MANSLKIPKEYSEVVNGGTENTMTKSLKIPKGYSEVVNRRTENTMAKRKRTKGRTKIYKTLQMKLKIEQDEPH